jgi:hypothetical protein
MAWIVLLDTHEPHHGTLAELADTAHPEPGSLVKTPDAVHRVAQVLDGPGAPDLPTWWAAKLSRLN